MWHSLFVVQIPVLEKIIRTVAVYVLIVLIFRIIGKRSISSLNTMDFVVMFLLSNVVQNAIIGNDNSYLGGAIGAVTLVATNTLVTRLALVSPAFRRLVEGTAVDVITDGVADRAALRRLGIRRDELDHAIRTQNGDDITEIGKGTLEPGGQLVLTLKPSEQDATHGDISELTTRLERIEALLLARSDGPA
ncbi:Uncharacterized membrane protein YcaP, DUF421 family [Nakamurella panacisegetis]|uniref:Uncharacterized membrane protein YcaP, DUF421 family n=1 Tax=Nakamurella panacisegetis TaxID=1090615 RepID=A0A1H0NIL1_9ACTN|nr:YetF domain-containing protein [Nakamurella panacisegetis]SDO92245.1 Uncharacterized membrane protein YcaP, DUF421 family [Nakamurella panacisegetis]